MMARRRPSLPLLEDHRTPFVRWHQIQGLDMVMALFNTYLPTLANLQSNCRNNDFIQHSSSRTAWTRLCIGRAKAKSGAIGLVVWPSTCTIAPSNGTCLTSSHESAKEAPESTTNIYQNTTSWSRVLR